MNTCHRTFATGDAELLVEMRGRGEPLLLLHGLMGTGLDWAHVFDLDALAGNYRLVIPDARGHGRSTNPTGAFTFRSCALDVLAVMDSLGIEKASAVGMSLGAKTLLHLATLAPERLSAMVLVSPAPRFPDPTLSFLRAAADAPHTPEEWAAMRRQHLQGDAQIAALWALPGLFADDPADMSFTPERLGTITARTLIVAGDRDPLYPIDLAIELQRGIPRSSLWAVAEGGHLPIFGRERDAFVVRALDFLEDAQFADACLRESPEPPPEPPSPTAKATR